MKYIYQLRRLLLLISLMVGACHAESMNDSASGSPPAAESASFSINGKHYPAIDIKRCNSEIPGGLDLFIKSTDRVWLIMDTPTRDGTGKLDLRLHGKHMQEQYGAMTFYHHPELSYEIKGSKIVGKAIVANRLAMESAKKVELVFNIPIPTARVQCPKH